MLGSDNQRPDDAVPGPADRVQGVVYLGRGQAGERVAIKVLHGEEDESFWFRELSMAR